MVKVPTPSYQGAGELGGVRSVGIREAQPHNFAAGVADAWRPWAQLAGGMAELGGQLQKQENEKNLLEIQNATAEWERDRMFGEGGWASQDGEDAFGLTDRADQEWKEFQSQLLEGRNLNGASRKAAEKYLAGRRNDTLGKLAGAEFKSREAYAVNQLNAGIENEVLTAVSYWSNPTDVAVHTSLALQKLDQVHERQGIALDSPQAQKAEKALMTDITKGVFNNMRSEDPVRALAYLNGAEAAGNIDGVSASAMRLQVTDEAKKYYGDTIGKNAFSGLSQAGTPGALPSGSIVDFMIGTPDAPGALIDVEGAYKVAARDGVSAGQVMSPTNDLGVAQLNVAIRNPSNPSKRGHFGYGVQIDVDRYESGDIEYQHKTARDMFNALYTHPKSPTRGNWVLTALAYNAGAGRVDKWVKAGMPLDGEGALDPITENYVKKITNGAVDLEKLGAARAVAMGEAGGTADGLPTAGVDMQVRETTAKQGGAADEYAIFNELLKIPDPKVRDAAIQSFLQMGQQKARMESKIREDLQNQAFSWLDSGSGSLDDFLAQNPDARNILGTALPSLRDYERRGVYVDPTEGEILFQDYMTDPTAFADMTVEHFEQTFRPMFGNEDYVNHRSRFLDLKLTAQNAQLTDEVERQEMAQKAQTGKGDFALSATDASRAVKDAGARLGMDQPSKDNPEIARAYAKAEARITAEYNRFVQEKKRPMSTLELMALTDREMLSTIQLDPGFFSANRQLTVDNLIDELTAASLSGGIIDDDDFKTIEIPVRLPSEKGGGIQMQGDEPVTKTYKPEQIRRFTEDYRRRNPGATMRDVAYALMAQHGWAIEEGDQ